MSNEDRFAEGATNDMSDDAPLTKEDPCPVAGKYNNKPIKEIPLSYLNWLIQQDWFGGKYPEMAEYVNNADPADHIQTLTGDSQFPMRGKHYGTPMKDVPVGYYAWLIKQDWAEEKYPEIIMYYNEHQDELSEESSDEAEAWKEARRRAEE